jgi:hypothetical protein
VVISVEFDWEDHGSIPRKCNWVGAGTCTPDSDSTGGENQKIKFEITKK